MVVGEVNIETDVVVLGGGPAGYVAAIRAAELGLATVLVERDERPGGLCLHRGCMPSKALASVADLAYRARNAQAMGLRIGEVGVDMAATRAWQRDIVDRLSRGVSTLLERHGVTVVRGEGMPAEGNRVAVAAPHGAERYHARRGTIIATGATPRWAGGLRPDGERVITAIDALFLDQLPTAVAVVGADYVAVELAVALRKLGSVVALLGAGQPMLPEVDASLATLAQRGLRRLGISWRPAAQPLEVGGQGLRMAQGEKEEWLPAELVILGPCGRAPNVADLGLDLLPIRQDELGFLLVDERQRTSMDGIYAVGDVTPGPAWAHRAYRQGKVAAEVIAGQPAAYDPRAVPAIVLAEPELASAGLGEEAARELGYDPAVSTFPWSASGRALTLLAREGQTTVISDRESGAVLGVHIAGPQAGELIGEAALALEMGATLEDLAAVIHPHPRLNEGIAEAADLALGLPTHMLAPGKQG
jgi:dihydrolipoamide dehydrogenase